MKSRMYDRRIYALFLVTPILLFFVVSFRSYVVSGQERDAARPSAHKAAVSNASSASTGLFTVTGSGGGTDFGDYVSSSGALNQSYRFFIEVPAGLDTMSVDIFDADVGIGGSAEGLAGRDRARSSFNSSVNYSLRDPSGAVRPVAFSNGNASSPAGADNAWLTLFSSGTGRSFRDEFASASFGNNNGTDNFSGNWIETDSGGSGPASGGVQVAGGRLSMRRNGSVLGSTDTSVEREANLNSIGFTSAILSFDYSTSNNLDNSDTVEIRASSNGGSSWTTLATFSNDVSGTASFDITPYISSNTRIRIVLTDGFIPTLFGPTEEFFYVDNLQISDGGPATAGHWELRVDMSSAVTSGDDINAFGVRAHDGTAGSGGTELNVYVDGMAAFGANAPSSGTQSQDYTIYPYVTSGCSYAKNDFDYDSNSGDVGSMNFASRTGAFNQSFASASLSQNDVWNRSSITGFTTDKAADDYGIWTASVTVASYVVSGTPNGNYADFYLSNYAAAANPPTSNPVSNSFRLYLPTDAGTAPSKPYLTHSFAQAAGSNPVNAGQTGTMSVRVVFTNPTAHNVTFSSVNTVTANVPGSGVVFAGGVSATQGSIDAQPAVGASGNIVWNPGTVPPGASAYLFYTVNVSPASAGQRLPISATPASGNGTRARYLDETGNASQARAAYLFGPLCELAVTEGVANAAPTAASASIGGRVLAADGRGLKNAVVVVTSTDGESQMSRTGAFGYFNFEEVEVGQTYIVSVRSKKFEFEPRVISLVDTLADLDFFPIGANRNR